MKWMIPMACVMLLGACSGMTGGSSDTEKSGASAKPAESQGSSSVGGSGSSMGSSQMGGTGTDTPATTSPTPSSRPGPVISPSTGQ